jgi:hypothetical protein
MPHERRTSRNLLADLEALRAESRRNNRETLRVICAIEALKAEISKSQSETPATRPRKRQGPNEAP